MTTDAFREYAASFVTEDLALDAAPMSPYQALRKMTALEDLRQNGTFFTANRLAKELWRPVLPELGKDSVVLDPAGGAGDLLLPVAEWAAETDTELLIRLNDVEEVFLPLARSRVLKIADSVGVTTTCSDFLADTDFGAGVTHLAMNPPYFALDAERAWASGKVNAAAIFVEHALLHMPAGSMLLAVLPDVLRSGTRYQKWRNLVQSMGSIMRVSPQGQFDGDTDIHVFLLAVRVGDTSPSQPWVKGSESGDRLVDHCEVHVGPVVPHRDPEDGPTVPYLTARNLAAGESETRRFPGRLESGPMVLVNRTSRPGERPRVRARIYRDSTPAAVENHLLIVRPLDGTLSSCENVVEVLARDLTWEYLDQRIRCRHLTVAALKEIPWRT